MNRAWVVPVIFILTAGNPAHAAMRGLSTEELTAAADLVVDGTVERVDAHWSPDGRAIVSSATIAVTEVVRGKSTAANVTVEYAGGEIGDTGMKVSDVEPFAEGERVLLFLKHLRATRGGEVHGLVGKAQGKYVIGGDNIARKKGFSLVSGNEIIDDNIDINELKKKIRIR